MLKVPENLFEEQKTLLERYRALVENALVGVYVLQDGNIVYANPQLVKIFGYEADEMIGLAAKATVAPEDCEWVHEKGHERLSGKVKADRYIYNALRKDGTVFPVEIFSSLIQFNNAPASQGMIVDITERQESRRLFDRWIEIGTGILSETDINTILQRVCDAIVEHSPFQAAAMTVFAHPVHPHQEDVQITNLYVGGVTDAERREMVKIKDEQGFISNRAIMEHGQRIGKCFYLTPQHYSELEEKSVRLSSRRELLEKSQWGPHDNLYIMLQQGELLLGRISVAEPQNAKIPSPETLEPLELLANLAALAVKNTLQVLALKDRAIRDGLTGLYNRRYFNESLEQELQRANRYQHPISILFIDVDHMHQINNTFGHLKGDFLLQAVANLLSDTVRSSDLIFRFGGDEFVALLPETNGEAGILPDRIKRAERRWNKEHQDTGIQMSLSMGISSWEPGSNQTLEDIIQQADLRMYEEKRSH